MNTFVMNVNRELSIREITWRDLAKDTGISERTMANWRYLGHSPKLADAVSICRYLAISLDEFCGLDPVSRNERVMELCQHLRSAPPEVVASIRTLLGIVG